jgi:hypothetical protein
MWWWRSAGGGSLAMLLAIVVFGAIACTTGTARKSAPDMSRPLAEGETIGLSGSTTPDAAEARTLLSLSCVNGRLIVKTNLDGIVGAMDCVTQPPQAALEQFLARPVVITYSGGHLLLKNPTASLDLTASDIRVTASNATP